MAAALRALHEDQIHPLALHAADQRREGSGVLELHQRGHGSTLRFNLQAFINDQAATYGKTPAEIGLLISGVRDRVANIERDTIKQAAASGGREAIALEKAVTGIFRKLGFDLSEHIGQKTASNREGGYPDIRIRLRA